MIGHEYIKQQVAFAIANSTEIRDFCIREFGRGLQVIVNAYGAKGWPGEEESPFAFLYSDGENESGNVAEETFEIVCVIGAASATDGTDCVTEAPRTNEQNGLVINGMAEKIEALRGIVEEIVRAGDFGAVLDTTTRTESAVLDWPLEWATLRLGFYEPETL